MGLVLGASAWISCGWEPTPSLPPIAVQRAPDRIAPVISQRPLRPLNVVLISIDTLRADHLSSYGYPRPTSPSLDRLASQGVLFENAFSHAPMTAPSHMSLMTALYPESHGVLNTDAGADPVPGSSLAEGIPTLASILKASGYRTEAFTRGGNMHASHGFARGFDRYEHLRSDAQGIFHEAIEALRRLSDGAQQPFLLFVHTYQTHAPYLAPAEHRKRFVDAGYGGRITGDRGELMREVGMRYESIHAEFWRRVDRSDPRDTQQLRDLYDACILYTDEQVGKLLAALEELELDDRTIVVVLSDHGEQFLEHGKFEHDELYDELLRVPLIVRVPNGVGGFTAGLRPTPTVRLVDVMPTLLDLLGLEEPKHLQGRSLLPLLAEEEMIPRYLFAQHRSEGLSALRAGSWKLIQGAPDPQLFNLERDPDERHNRSESHPELLGSALRTLGDLLSTSRAYRGLAGPAEPAEVDDRTRRELEALGYVR